MEIFILLLRRSQAIKTSEVWQSIPYQLAKENKKFKYSDVRKKAQDSKFEQTIEWLINAGLIYLSYNLRTPKPPFSDYTHYSKFKIYLLHVGLLGAMLNLTRIIHHFRMNNDNKLLQKY